MITVIL